MSWKRLHGLPPPPGDQRKVETQTSGSRRWWRGATRPVSFPGWDKGNLKEFPADRVRRLDTALWAPVLMETTSLG